MNGDSSPIPWLLEAATPAIRYLTLTRLLDLPKDDARVRQARQENSSVGPVQAILARQSERGSWTGEHDYYTPKYTSTHWSMLLLAELQAGVDAPAGMRLGAEFMLQDTQAKIARNQATGNWDIECLWGNILRYALECGWQDDERAQQMLNYLVACALQGEWRCPHNDNRPCAWGAARTLWALAAMRERASIPGAEQAAASAVHFLLEEYSLVDANYPTPSGKISRFWFKLNFPLFYQADILFVLRVMGELGLLGHPGARPALEWLANQRGPDGRFPGVSPFRRRTYAGMGRPEETRRWVTLQAETVLKEAESFH